MYFFMFLKSGEWGTGVGVACVSYITNAHVSVQLHIYALGNLSGLWQPRAAATSITCACASEQQSKYRWCNTTQHLLQYLRECKTLHQNLSAFIIARIKLHVAWRLQDRNALQFCVSLFLKRYLEAGVNWIEVGVEKSNPLPLSWFPVLNPLPLKLYINVYVFLYAASTNFIRTQEAVLLSINQAIEPSSSVLSTLADSFSPGFQMGDIPSLPGDVED